MNKPLSFLAAIFWMLLAPQAGAYTDSAWTLGLGYYSQNAFYKTSQDSYAKTGFNGETSYPFLAKYDVSFFSEWFFSPQFGYTLIPRATKDNAAKVTTAILNLQFGQNISDSGFDWFIGPGVNWYQIQGSGGSATLNNGTTTTNFILPSGYRQFYKVTVNTGISYSFGPHRIELDVIMESAFSNSKRAESFMLSYGYVMGSDNFSRAFRR